jgi:hypothetical protein
MKPETLVELLSATEGVRPETGKKEGGGLLLDPSMEATLYAGIGGELLQVAKVTRIEIQGRFVMAETQKGERFFLDGETVKGVKLERLPEGARRDRTAGFGK